MTRKAKDSLSPPNIARLSVFPPDPDSERPVDLRRTSFTLLGLLASTCSLMMEERGGANNLPQAPSEEGTGRAHDVVAGGGGDRARAIESLKPRKILPRGHFDVKIRNAAAHPPRFTWKQRTLGFDGEPCNQCE